MTWTVILGALSDMLTHRSGQRQHGLPISVPFSKAVPLTYTHYYHLNMPYDFLKMALLRRYDLKEDS